MTDSGGRCTTLSEQERRQWCDDGFLVLREVLNPAETADALQAIRLVHTAERDAEGRKWSGKPHSVRIRRAIELSDAFDSLIDHALVLPTLIEVLGNHLQLLGTNILIREPCDTPLEQFHTDGGPSLQMIRWSPSGPAIQCKVQFFLTDLAEPNSGNFMVVRGSHLRPPSRFESGCYVPEANEFLVDNRYPPGTEQLLTRAGDVVIFPHSIWHGVAPNRSSQVRYSVIFAYGQICLRPHEHGELPAAVLARMSPRQRRLCGDVGSEEPNFYFPLRQSEIMAGHTSDNLAEG